MTPQPLILSVLVMAHIVWCSPALASEANHEAIGLYTAVSGHVVATHQMEGRVVPVKLHDQVWFKDVIETKGDSRTKAFFDDDSMLTVGTNSRVEIDEYVYQPDNNVRRAVVKLMQGQVRALVSKVFKANGSKFEVHTPSAVAAARGTYFTVWVENGQSGIINIGETGRVDFTSGGITIAVDPGYFSVAREGQAPSTPMEHHLGRASSEAGTSNAVPSHDRALDTAPPQASAELTETSPLTGLAQALVSVERTLLREELLLASPIEALTAMNVDARIMATLTNLISLTTESLESTAIVDGTLNGTGSTTVLGQVRVDVQDQGGTLVSLGTGTGGVTAAVGSVSVGPVNLGPLSVGPVSAGPVSLGPLSANPVNVGPVSLGPLSVGPVSVSPVSLGPLSVGPLTAAPTVIAPALTLPTVTVAVPVVPIPPITIAPVTAVPTTPILTVPVTPPAVISGVLNLLKP
jgi:hypothetical protein